MINKYYIFNYLHPFPYILINIRKMENDGFTEKVIIASHEINGPFIKQFENIQDLYQHHNFRINLWQALEKDYNFIEYMLVVVDGILDDTRLKITCNGQDMWQDSPAIYYRKVLPFECRGLYDEETNKLLEDMIKENKDCYNIQQLKKGDDVNVLFLPFRTTKNGYLLDITPTTKGQIPYHAIDNMSLRIMGLQSDGEKKVSIYLKLSKENSKNVEKINYSLL